MFVCLCKAITESDVARAARDCSASGCASTDEVMQRLGLHCEEACGFCIAHPESFVSIAEEEWAAGRAQATAVS